MGIAPLDYYLKNVYITKVMKVFFTASREGKQYFDYYYQQIDEFLANESYENLNRDFLLGKTNVNQTTNRKELLLINKQLLEKISQADLCLFECSMKSITVGFLIQKALEMEKPVIALYLEGHLPSFLAGLENEKFQLLEYDKNNLIKRLKEAVVKASFLADKRFNFFVSSSMLAYLNSQSRKLGITKSTFIRNLIEEYRKNNS